MFSDSSHSLRTSPRTAPPTLHKALRAAATVALAFTVMAGCSTEARSDSPPPESSEASDEAPAAAGKNFSHDAWTTVLQERVNDQGLVDYKGLAKDRSTFDAYLDKIRSVSPKTDPDLFPNRDHELAYYINAYNAHVFNGVLDRGPEDDTVWTPFGSGYSFFSGMDITVGGEKTNLKKLEDDVVRAKYKDPRVHAALNCASLGCPHLPRTAFTGAQLDQQLDREMGKFISEERNVSVDASKKEVRLSQIFEWFEGDFLAFEKAQGNADPSILDYINRFRPKGKKIPEGYKVSYIKYDKGINAQS